VGDNAMAWLNARSIPASAALNNAGSCWVTL
jgi:hypothetical protein